MLRMKRFGGMREAGGLCIGLVSFTQQVSISGSCCCCDVLHHPICAERRLPATTMVFASRSFTEQRRLFSTQRHHHQKSSYTPTTTMMTGASTGGSKRRAHLAHVSPMFSTLPLEPFGNLNQKQTQQLVGHGIAGAAAKTRNLPQPAISQYVSKRNKKFHRSHQHQELLKTIVNSTLNGVSVVLSGPTGSGKGLMAATVAEEIDRNSRHRQQQQQQQQYHQYAPFNADATNTCSTYYVLTEEELLCMRLEDRVAAGLVPWETAAEGVGGDSATLGALFSEDDALTRKSRKLALYIGSIESNIFLGATPLLAPKAARAYLLLRNTDLPPPTEGTRLFVSQWLKAKVLTMPPRSQTSLLATANTHHSHHGGNTIIGISGASTLRRLVGSWGCRFDEDWEVRGGAHVKGQDDDGQETIDVLPNNSAAYQSLTTRTTTPPPSPPSLPRSPTSPTCMSKDNTVVAIDVENAAHHDLRIRICATDEASEQQNTALHMKHLSEVRAVAFSKGLPLRGKRAGGEGGKENRGSEANMDGFLSKPKLSSFSSSNSDLLINGTVMRIPLQSTTTWKLSDSNVVLLLIPKKNDLILGSGGVDDPSSRIMNTIRPHQHLPQPPPPSLGTSSTFIQNGDDEDTSHLSAPTATDAPSATYQGQEGWMCHDDDDYAHENGKGLCSKGHNGEGLHEGITSFSDFNNSDSSDEAGPPLLYSSQPLHFESATHHMSQQQDVPYGFPPPPPEEENLFTASYPVHDEASNHYSSTGTWGESEGAASSLSIEQQLSFPEGSSWVLVGDFTPTIVNAHGTISLSSTPSPSLSSTNTKLIGDTNHLHDFTALSSSSYSLYGAPARDEYEVWALRLPRDFYVQLTSQRQRQQSTCYADYVQRAILDKMMGRPLDDGDSFEMGNSMKDVSSICSSSSHSNSNLSSGSNHRYTNTSSSSSTNMLPPWVHFVMAESLLKEFQFKWEQKHTAAQHHRHAEHHKKSFSSSNGGRGRGEGFTATRSLRPETSTRNGWPRPRADDGDDADDQRENEWSTSMGDENRGDFTFTRNKNSTNNSQGQFDNRNEGREERDGTSNYNDTFGARGMGRRGGEDRDFDNTQYDVGRDGGRPPGGRKYPQKEAYHKSTPHESTAATTNPSTAHHIDLAVGSPVIYRNRLRVVVGFALPPPPPPPPDSSSLHQQGGDTTGRNTNTNTSTFAATIEGEGNGAEQPNTTVNVSVCCAKENKVTPSSVSSLSSGRFHTYAFFSSPLPILDGGEVVEPQILSQEARQGIEEEEEEVNRVPSGRRGEQYDEDEDDEWGEDQIRQMNNNNNNNSANDDYHGTYSPSIRGTTSTSSSSRVLARVPYPFVAQEVVVPIRLAYAVSARQLLLPPYAATKEPLQPQPESPPPPHLARFLNYNNYNDTNNKKRYGESEEFTEDFSSNSNNSNNTNTNYGSCSSVDDRRSGARTSSPTATVMSPPLSPSCDSIVGLLAHPSSTAYIGTSIKNRRSQNDYGFSSSEHVSLIAELNTMEWLVAGELHHIAASVTNHSTNDRQEEDHMSRMGDKRYTGRKSFQQQQQQPRDAEGHAPPPEAQYKPPRYDSNNINSASSGTGGLHHSPTFFSFQKKRRQIVAESMGSRFLCRLENGVQSVNDTSFSPVAIPKPRDTLSVGGIVGTDSGALHPLLGDHSPLLLRIESLGFCDVHPTHSPLYLL